MYYPFIIVVRKPAHEVNCHVMGKGSFVGAVRDDDELENNFYEKEN